MRRNPLLLCCLCCLIYGHVRADDSDDLGLGGADLGKILSGSSPQSLADMLLPQIGSAMGLPPRQAVVVREEDRSGLRDTLLQIMKRQYPGDTLERMNAAYQQLGLVPTGVNLREEALKLYSGQVAGFYDAHSGHLALVRGGAPMQQVQVLQHELAHALQDQYFGLQKLIDAVVLDEDQALALQAVIEGQAVVAMFAGATASAPGSNDNAPRTKEEARALLEAAGMNVSDEELDSMAGGGSGHDKPSLAQLMIPDKPVAAGVPYLQAQLLFPYQEGTRFIEHFMEGSSFPETIARTLGHPPRSTRQILHPDAYSANKAPVPVTLAYSMPEHADWQTTVGELNIRTLLGESAAAGWTGDHLAALRSAGSMAVVWLSVWENGSEASEFARALTQVFTARADSVHDGLFKRGARTDVIVKSGRVVGVLAGIPQAQQAAWVARLQQDMGVLAK